METNFKFGITERGDAGLDLSWSDRLNAVVGAVIISKSASPEFEDQLIKYKNKCIYHATCTGLGGSIVEPNVPTYQEKLQHIYRLISKGFPRKQIVIRIDPLFPRNMVSGLEEALGINYISVLKSILKFAEENKIDRIRYSYLDLSDHSVKRLKKLMFKFLGNGNLGDFEIELEKLNPNLVYEACAENKVPCEHKIGCISDTDLKILKLDKKYLLTHYHTSRGLCLCPDQKLELLNNPYRCAHGCEYCYWRDKE